jgi:integrase
VFDTRSDTTSKHGGPNLSTKDIAKARTKPPKPYPDFPLFPHANGQWAKKVKGKFAFFGPWRDPEGALQRYLDQKDELHAGRVPRSVQQDALTLRVLVNHFLTAKKRKVDAGELKLMSFNSLYRTSRTLIELLGPERRIDDISPDDFGRLRAKFADGHGPVYTGDQVQRTRAVFKYGHEAGLLSAPMRFGPEFIKPSRKNVRLAKRDAPKRLFTPAEIHGLLKHASVPMKAMILLGINCGMGNTDVAELRMGAIDLKKGVIAYPRPKTGVDRRAPLWKETVAALKAAIAARPEPASKDHEGLLFITRWGNPWIQVGPPTRVKCRKCRSMFSPDVEDGAVRCPKCDAVAPPRTTQASMTDSVANEFQKLFVLAGIKRNGRGMYSLRHTFRTVADEIGDRPAIDKIMGHENATDMRTHYVERIDDRRLRRVTGHIYRWLRGNAARSCR